MKKLALLSIICFFAGFFSISTAQTSSDSVVVQQKEIIQLDTEGGKVYSGIKQLKRKEVENVLAPYPEIYLQYKSGMKLKSKGTGLLIGGAVTALAGTGLMLYGIDNNNYYDDIDANVIIGSVGAIVGALMLDAGLVCTVVGNIKTVQSIKNYKKATNIQAEQNSPQNIQYQLGLLDNGKVGLQLTF